MASNAIRIAVLANASQARRELEGTATTAEKIEGKFSKLRLPATVALGAIALGAKQSINAASDLNEEISKSEQIFGKQAGVIQKFASGAATSLGQSKQVALDAASTFGLIGQKAGLSGKETAAFSKQFVTLSSDLASFNNTTPEEAITAIGAAMRGESEPIRKYGVLLDDATLRARAVKMGLIATVKEGLTPQQKALAASQEILAQTTKAQGDFARTSDGAANKSRIITAQVENLKASLGQALLPAYQAVLSAMSKFVGFATEHPTAVKVLVGVIAGLAAAVLAASAATKVYNAAMMIQKGVMVAYQAVIAAVKVAQIALWVVMAANPIVLVIAAIVALVAVFVIAYKKSETFRDIVNKAWGAIKDATGAVWEWVKDKVAAVWNFFTTTIPNKVGKVKDSVVDAWQNVKTKTGELWESVKTTVQNKVEDVVEKVKDIKTKVTNFFMNAAQWLLAEGRQLIAGLISGIGEKFEDVRNKLTNLKEAITGKFSGVLNWLEEVGRDLIRGLINGIGAMAQRAIDAAKGVVDGAIKAAKNLLGISSPSKVFKRFGEQTGQGLVIGLDRMGGKASRAASELAQAVSDGFGAPELAVTASTSSDPVAALEAVYKARQEERTRITVTLSAQQIDQLSRGRAIQADLDAYRRAGGRATA